MRRPLPDEDAVHDRPARGTRDLLPIAFALAALLGLIVAAPASAIASGILCSEVTGFTAPTLVADGSITIDGTTETIDRSASIDASLLALLTSLANGGEMTCLDVTANQAGEITDLDIASQARICGIAWVNPTTGVVEVDGVEYPINLVASGASDGSVDVQSGENVCVDTTVDPTTGQFASAALTGGGGSGLAGALPDTALGQPAAPITLGVVLLLAAGIGFSVSRQARNTR